MTLAAILCAVSFITTFYLINCCNRYKKQNMSDFLREELDNYPF